MKRSTVAILLATACLAGCGKEEMVETPVVETPVVEEPEEWESTEVNTLMNIYFRQLAQLEQDVYKQIMYEVSNGNCEITMCRGLDEQGVKNVVTAFIYDNPEMFWLTGEYTLEGDVIKLETNSLATDLNKNKETFNTSIEELMKDLYFPYKADDYIKEKLIHDKLLSVVSEVAKIEKTEVVEDINTDMDEDEDDEEEVVEVTPVVIEDLSYTAYEAIVNKKASNDGYTKALQVLLKQSGIPCYYSYGRLHQNDKTVEHSWNVVRLSDGHYNVDPYLNDTVLGSFNAVSYEFYNVSDNKISKSHTRNSVSRGLPAIDGKELTYKKLYGESCAMGALKSLNLDNSYLVNSLEEFDSYVVNKIVAGGLGTHTFKVVVTSEELFNEAHYALKVRTQDYITSINKEGWQKLSIESEEHSLGDNHYLIEATYIMEYVDVKAEEAKKAAEKEAASLGSGW